MPLLSRRNLRLALPAVAAAGALAAAWAVRAPAATALIRAGLSMAGVDNALTVREVTPTRLILEGLSLGRVDAPAVAARRIEARYFPTELFGARVRALYADGLEVRARLDEEGLRFEGLPIDLGGGGEAASPAARRAPPATPRIEAPDARLYLDTPAGELVADASVAGGPGEGWRASMEAYEAHLASDAGEVTLAEGRAEFELTPERAEGMLALEIADLAGTAGGADRLRAEASFSGALIDPARLGTLAGDGEVSLTADGVRLAEDAAANWAGKLEPALVGPGAALAGPHLAALADALARALAGVDASFTAPIALNEARLTFGPGSGLRAQAESGLVASFIAGDAGRATFDFLTRDVEAGDLAARAGGGGFPEASFEIATAERSRDDGVRQLVVEGAGRVAPWAADGLTLSTGLDAARLELSPDGWRLAAVGRLEADGARLGVDARLARLDADLIVEGNPTGVALRPLEDDRPPKLTARALTVSGTPIADLALALNPFTPGDPIVEVRATGVTAATRLADADLKLLIAGGSHRVRLPAAEFRLSAPAGGAAEIEARAQGPRLEGRLQDGRDLRGEARIIDATARLGETIDLTARLDAASASGAALPISVRDAAGLVEVNLKEGRVDSGRFEIARGRVRDAADAPRFADIDLTLDGRIAEGVATGSGAARTSTGAEVATMQFQHHFADGLGKAQFASPRLVFAPGGLQPTLFAPVLRGIVADVAGAAKISGSARWGGEEPATVAAGLALEDVDFFTRLGRVEGLSSTFSFTDLLTLTTDGVQAIDIDLFDPGVPLQDGRIRLAFTGGGNAFVETAEFPFAGGRLALDPMEWIAGDQDQRGAVSVTGVSIAEVVALFKPPGLTASGEVAGRIPLIFASRSLLADEGKLTTVGGGEIRYQGKAAEAAASASEGGKIAFEALKNLQFDMLEITLNGDLAGAMTMRIDAKGTSPELYGGAPVEFTANFNAEFARLISRTFRPVDLGETWREMNEAEKR